MRSSRVVVAGVAVLTAGVLAACGSGNALAGDRGTLPPGGRVRVGIPFDEPSLGLKTGSTYQGFDVDVASYIAQKLGVTTEFVEALSSQRETLIATGQVKYVVATYSITDARKEKVSFAGPYFVAGQDLLVRSDDTTITGPDQLAGKRLCSVKGTTSASTLQERYPAVTLQQFSTYSLCLDALKRGDVDALTADDTILAGYSALPANAGRLRVVGRPFTTESYGIGLAKGDTAFCQQVTDALLDFVSSGAWQRSVSTWFGAAGFTPGKSNPPTPTACS